MYLEAKLADLEPYADAFCGDVDADACIVAFGELPEELSVALHAACEGIGMDGPVVVDVARLSAPDDAFALVEGLDPAALVVADEVAAAFLADAYREQVALDACGRLFGRPVAAFTSFQADLADMAAKQRNWAVLKQLRAAVEHCG